jgi:hypothetical protein
MMPPVLIKSSDAHCPSQLGQRLNRTTPASLSALGSFDLLSLPKTALFCSALCPGVPILRTYDQAAKWRDDVILALRPRKRMEQLDFGVDYAIKYRLGHDNGGEEE